MKAKTIYRERPDIAKRVYEEYPVTKREKNCSIEKSKQEWLRFEAAKKYYEETPVTGKVEYETK